MTSSDRQQEPKMDSMGRIYNFAPGPAPQLLTYEEDLDNSKAALEICAWVDRPILEELIEVGTVVFKKSEGRRKTSRKTAYIHSVKVYEQSLFNVAWNYCIEVTENFNALNKESRYEALLNILQRIPERVNPGGALINFDSFTGFDEKLSKLRDILHSNLE